MRKRKPIRGKMCRDIVEIFAQQHGIRFRPVELMIALQLQIM
jgi:hypothetical protein